MVWYRRKWLVIPLATLVVIVLGLVIWIGPVYLAVKRAGILDPVQAEKYRPGREANLRALYTGLSLYHDSEDQFPRADGWMDAIEPRLQRNGVSKAEAQQKLIRPDLVGQPGKYGYELNQAVAGKYRDDLAPEMTLVTETDNTARNANGSGKIEPGYWAITVTGKLIMTTENK